MEVTVYLAVVKAERMRCSDIHYIIVCELVLQNKALLPHMYRGYLLILWCWLVSQALLKLLWINKEKYNYVIL
jgi:hypothetical protein